VVLGDDALAEPVAHARGDRHRVGTDDRASSVDVVAAEVKHVPVPHRAGFEAPEILRHAVGLGGADDELRLCGDRLADISALNEPASHRVGRLETGGLPDHELDAGTVARRDHLATVRRARGHGLLAQDVLARSGGGHRDVAMELGRHAYYHHVNVIARH